MLKIDPSTDVIEKVEAVAAEVVEHVETAAAEAKKSRSFKNFVKKIPFGKFGLVVLVFLAIGATGASIYFYDKYQTAQVLGSQDSDAVDLQSKVGKLMDLPQEEPVAATVSDVERLRSQPFFARAKNGDKVLFYQSIKKAILYRPSINKIIEVATINLNGSAVSGTPTPSVSPSPEAKEGPFTVFILNGTTTSGLAVTAEKVAEGIEDLTIERGDAQKKDYEKNLVINVGGIPDGKVQELAKIFNADIVSLPDSETAPDGADVIVILGREFITNSEE